MEVFIRVEVERTEGMNRARDLVEEEIIGLLDGECLSVDESEFEITSVEVIAEPKPPKPPKPLSSKPRIPKGVKVLRVENRGDEEVPYGWVYFAGERAGEDGPRLGFAKERGFWWGWGEGGDAHLAAAFEALREAGIDPQGLLPTKGPID